MKNTKTYIENINWRRRLFNKDEMDINNLTDEDIKDIYRSLLGDLSPENIHSDGEASSTEVNRRRAFYRAVYRELKALGYDNEDIKWYL